jgi:hypothetical protein
MTKMQLHCDYSMIANMTKVVCTKILQTSLRCERATQYCMYTLYAPVSKMRQLCKELLHNDYAMNEYIMTML